MLLTKLLKPDVMLENIPGSGVGCLGASAIPCGW